MRWINERTYVQSLAAVGEVDFGSVSGHANRDKLESHGDVLDEF